ncbi:MAG: DUF4369 domain-containing protein [Bacteroidales bacterium]
MSNRLFILVLLLAFVSCGKQDKFKIEGEFSEHDTTTVYLKENNVSQTATVDSAETNKNGEFSFKGSLEYPKFYQVGVSDNNFINLLISPGETVQLNASSDRLSEYEVDGSAGSEKVQLLDNRLRNTKTKLDSLSGLYQQKEALDAPEDTLEEIDEEYRAVLNRNRDSSIAFIVNNLSSLASIMALYQKVDPETFVLYKNTDLQYIKIVADSVKEKYPDSPQVKALLANKEDLMEKYNNMALTRRIESFTDNADYQIPNIRLPDFNEDTVALHGIQEPMILLSFWSATDKSSVERNLELKKLYNRYHKKGFEIYQVSLDEDKERWTRAINFDELPWINVNSEEGSDAHVARIYNVRSLPTEYLINRNREIIKRNPDISELKRHLSIALD